MSDELKPYKGNDLPSLEGLSFTGTFHPDYFRVFRNGIVKTFNPLEQLFHQNSNFKLFGPASGPSSRGIPSNETSSETRSTLTSEHPKLQRYVCDGDTVKPLQTLHTQDVERPQVQNIEISIENGLKRKRSSVPPNSEPNSSRQGRKCLELLKKKSTIAIIGAVLLFLLIAVGVGIYFGVTNKSRDKTTTAWQNSTYQPSFFTTNTTSQFSTVFVNHTAYSFSHSVATISQHSTATANETDPSSGQTNQATTTTQITSSS